MTFYVSSLFSHRKGLNSALSQLENSHEIKPWLFYCWEEKCQKYFQVFLARPCDFKMDNWEYLRGPTQKIFNFFLYTSSTYEWFLQEFQMACVFAIKISIYIVWEIGMGKNVRNNKRITRHSRICTSSKLLIKLIVW